jgi:hypothetical protein
MKPTAFSVSREPYRSPGDAGHERADERAKQGARDGKAVPEAAGVEVKHPAYRFGDSRYHHRVEAEQQAREARGHDHAEIGRTPHRFPLAHRLYKKSELINENRFSYIKASITGVESWRPSLVCRPARP